MIANRSPQQPELGTPIDWSHPLASGLVGAWVFNEGTGGTVHNLAVTGVNDGALSGNPVWTPAQSARGISLVSTSSQAINCGSISPLNSATRATLFWRGALVSAKNVFVGRIARANFRYAADYASSGSTAFFILDTGAAQAFGGIGSVPVGEISLCSSFDGTQAANATRLTGYVNGVQRVLNFTGTIPSSMPNAGTDAFWLGRDVADSLYSDGRIDTVLLWAGRALLADEVARLHANPWQLFARPTLLPVASAIRRFRRTNYARAGSRSVA